ncbi:TetR/AcrR family transcriptional regulator [Paenibacillus terreus]|uniref:TetR/AcrR family transcriptional regulator n=1 Tax=Paenibacillus terreus TaxID=1387834 RepID=A0ABV5B752_9BACL
MPKVDRRILKTQEALKKAVIELMTEKSFDEITIQDLSDRANVSRGTIYLHYQDKYDLLDKLIEAHMNELREICLSSADLEYVEAELLWFEYFERHYLFFSTMLASKGAPFFRTRFLELVVSVLHEDSCQTEGRNEEFHSDLVIEFFASAIVGIVEWWFKNEKPYSPQVMAEQVGKLLERNL